MAIKLQLNSVEALERLIGGDTQVELELRNSIVQEFTRRHLKGLVNDHVTRLEYELRDYLRTKFEQCFGTYQKKGWQGTVFSLNKDMNEVIQEVVKETKEKLIIKKVRETIENDANFEQQIQEAVDRQISLSIHMQVKEMVRAKLKTISEGLESS